MAQRTVQMFVVLLSLFAIFLRYVRTQMNSTDDQGIHCISKQELLLVLQAHVETAFNFFSVKEAKSNAQIRTIECRRIPQNVMGVGEAEWFSIQDRVFNFTMYPVLQGKKKFETF